MFKSIDLGFFKEDKVAAFLSQRLTPVHGYALLWSSAYMAVYCDTILHYSTATMTAVF